MGPQIIVFVHAPVEITKHQKVGLRYAVLEAGVCFGVLDGMRGQIIQRKTTIQSIEVSLNKFFEWFETGKHVKNECNSARRHEIIKGTKTRRYEKYI